MRKYGRFCPVVPGFVLFLLCTTFSDAAEQKVFLKGHVYDRSTCAGLAHLTVELTPSAKLRGKAVLITYADENGDFQVEGQEYGDYYLAIFQGMNQVYGHVIRFRDANPIPIALKSVTPTQGRSAIGCLTPVALAVSSTGDLFVLDSHNGILRYSTANPRSAPQVVAALSSDWQAIDMAVAKIGQGEHLFVAVAQGGAGQLMRYSTQGQFEGSWYQFSPLSGVSVDEPAGRVYVATWGTDKLFQQSLSAPENSQLQLLVPIFNARDIGSLATDSEGRTLYVAEQITGQIRAVELTSMTVKEIADSVGQPTALAFDRTNKRLLIADADGRRVWAVSVYPRLGKPVKFVESRLLYTPSAIAVGQDGTVWVGDQSAHAIFHFASDQRLLNTIR